MTRKIPLLAAALTVAVLALAGCSSAPAAKPTTTEKVDVNYAACEAAKKASDDMGTAYASSGTKTDWENTRAAFDAAGLQAKGDVKTRIEALVSDWPEYGSFMFGSFDDFNASLNDIGRACQASGTNVTMNQFTRASS